MIEIKSRHGDVIQSGEGVLVEVLRAAVVAGVSLSDADLRGADLGGADLGGAYLGDADLRGADLGGADLGGAYLGGADLSDADLRGADLGGAYLGGADLGGADLSDADLRGADLGGADLGGADLGGAVMSDASATEPQRPRPEYKRPTTEEERRQRALERAARYREQHPDVPIIEALDRRIFDIIKSGSGALEMSTWHTCETTHCRAGWAIALAGDVGKKLEQEHGSQRAGAMLYRVSTGRVPNFFASNEAAMADLKRRAEQA